MDPADIHNVTDQPGRATTAARHRFRRIVKTSGLLAAWSLAVLISAGCAAVGGERPDSEKAETTETPATPDDPGATPPPSVELQNFGLAPELTNEVWLNTDRPLRLADLRGKVVLIEMWTFG